MKKKVLLVEDTATIQQMYKGKLLLEQFEVLTADHGGEALQILARERPDLILLDLMLPLVDGFKVLQVVKTDPRLQEVPVIVFSAKGQPEEIERAMKLGATDFLIKSVSKPKDVVDKIKKVLAETTVKGSAPAYRVAIQEEGLDIQSLFRDFAVALCPRCGGRQVLELVPDFTQASPWFSAHFVCHSCLSAAPSRASQASGGR